MNGYAGGLCTFVQMGIYGFGSVAVAGVIASGLAVFGIVQYTEAKLLASVWQAPLVSTVSITSLVMVRITTLSSMERRNLYSLFTLPKGIVLIYRNIIIYPLLISSY
jgi:hypothetical protein